jgi:hypothetical protein
LTTAGTCAWCLSGWGCRCTTSCARTATGPSTRTSSAPLAASCWRRSHTCTTWASSTQTSSRRTSCCSRRNTIRRRRQQIPGRLFAPVLHASVITSLDAPAKILMHSLQQLRPRGTKQVFIIAPQRSSQGTHSHAGFWPCVEDGREGSNEQACRSQAALHLGHNRKRASCWVIWSASLEGDIADDAAALQGGAAGDHLGRGAGGRPPGHGARRPGAPRGCHLAGVGTLAYLILMNLGVRCCVYLTHVDAGLRRYVPSGV